MSEFKTDKTKDLQNQPSGMIRVRWIRPHPLWAYKEGAVGLINSAAAETLSQYNTEIINGKDVTIQPYLMILPDDWTEPITEKIEIPEAEYVKVRFIKPAPGFAYHEGNVGKVTPAAFKMLMEGEFVEPYQEKRKPGIWGKLKNHFLK